MKLHQMLGLALQLFNILFNIPFFSGLAMLVSLGDCVLLRERLYWVPGGAGLVFPCAVVFRSPSRPCACRYYNNNVEQC